MNIKKLLSGALRIIAALILLQTLYFKFTGHPESVELFTKLGVEPWGRIGTGIIELFASILLVLPSSVIYGAFLGIGLMIGAIVSHLTIIGIESKGDGGQLFILACIVMVCCLVLLIFHKKQYMEIKNKLLFKNAKSISE